MKIAVTYENEDIFQHFWHTAQFKIYEIEDGKVVYSHIVDTNGSGHGALTEMLSKMHVESLICGGIGAGAQKALAEAGIQLYGGVSGNADLAIDVLLAGKLEFDPDARCDHHGHNGEGHSCGAEKHGCMGHDCTH